MLVRPRGIRGEIIADSLSDSGAARYESLKKITLLTPDGKPKGDYELEEVWDHQGRLVFKIAGVDSMTDAEPFRGLQVAVPKAERAPLEEGAFYYSDLVDCMVVDADSGEEFGKVLGFLETGAHGLLEVEGDLLIPYTKIFLIEIAPEKKLIRARLPEGLRELN